MKTYFSEIFNVREDDLESYGAFNISLITDLPLFVDPFLLFGSRKKEYQDLHQHLINYLRFLKKKSEIGEMPPSFLKNWYYFSEIKQNWLGFCKGGNSGRGLGAKFAKALDRNLVNIFKNFGDETITKGSHLEKLCLIRSGVGRDMISDFTNNLIKSFLLEYTETFAKKYIAENHKVSHSIDKAYFDYSLERWMPRNYTLPTFNNDFVLLTPKNILTKDETWICHKDMFDRFREIPLAMENDVLRTQVNNYFYSKLPKRKKGLTKEDNEAAMEATIEKFPEIVDYYIKLKEKKSEQASSKSAQKVSLSHLLYIKAFGELISLLQSVTPFYSLPSTTKNEAKEKIVFLKDVIENKGGYKIFYKNGKPNLVENDVQILYRLTWHNSMSTVTREANDGQGPVDFKISRSSKDITLVEFKLAKSTKLKQNLLKQLEIYQKSSSAEAGFKVIFFFNNKELKRASKILKDLKMEDDENIYLIDARNNKPSGSNAK